LKRCTNIEIIWKLVSLDSPEFREYYYYCFIIIDAEWFDVA